MQACRAGDTAAATLALASRADPNACDPSTQHTAIMLAAAAPCDDAAPLIRHLAACGARVRATTPSGLTALHAAAAAGRAAAVRTLLELGASATATDSGGRTPLHVTGSSRCGSDDAWAAEGAEETVEALAGAGASLTATDHSLRSPMACACTAGEAAAAYALWSRGAPLPPQITGDLASDLMDLIWQEVRKSEGLAALTERQDEVIRGLETITPGLRQLLIESLVGLKRAGSRGAGRCEAGSRQAVAKAAEVMAPRG